MKIYVYPYSSKSESAKLLAERLGAKRIRLQNSEYQYSPDHLVINWGNSYCPYPCLNSGDILQETVDKLKFFRKTNRRGYGHLLPNYWTDPDDVPDDAFPIFCRTEVKGHDGSGISIANNRKELLLAPLYTQAIRSGTEYRVTVFRDYGVTDIQTKLPRIGVEQSSEMIKTYSNGWGFQRKPIEDHLQGVLENLAEEVLDATEMDFCGIDVIVAPNGTPRVLEVNSAMGLEGQALEKFAEAVEWYAKEHFGTLPEPQPQPAPPTEDPIITAVRAENWADVIRIAAGRIS